MEIIFHTDDKFEQENYPVIPATSTLPDWYKNIGLVTGGKELIFKDGMSNSTIRKCIPFLDAMSSGYIIQLAQDIYVTREESVGDGQQYSKKIPYYSWAFGGNIQFHSQDQAPGHPANKANYPIPKFINKWSVITPDGYSCMFIPPLNRDDLPFRIMAGVVDTDKYNVPVNFPFVLVDPNFSGLIKAGTPIAQVIPFKRDSWRIKFGSVKHKNKIENAAQRLRRMAFNGYRKLFWTKKEFK